MDTRLDELFYHSHDSLKLYTPCVSYHIDQHMREWKSEINLLRELLQVKAEVSDRIMEQLTDRHEIMEIGIPPAGIVHPAIPFVVLDFVKLLYKGKMDPVIDSTDPLMRKYSSLQPGPRALIQLNGVVRPFSAEAKILEVHRGRYPHRRAIGSRAFKIMKPKVIWARISPLVQPGFRLCQRKSLSENEASSV